MSTWSAQQSESEHAQFALLNDHIDSQFVTTFTMFQIHIVNTVRGVVFKPLEKEHKVLIQLKIFAEVYKRSFDI